MILGLTTILGLAAAAELSRQVVHESELAQSIKSVLLLDGESVGRWKRWGSIKSWWEITGRWFFPLFPLILLTIILSQSMRLLASVLDCDRCLGYHFGWVLLYFFFGYALLPSLVFAPIVILWVYVIEKFKLKN